jgi:hypothetical protein
MPFSTTALLRVLLLAICAMAVVLGQDVTGTIAGVVRDASGAVPGVTVTANNTGTNGNIGRNIFQGVTRIGWDSGLHKDFPIRERLKAQFRFEVFNTLNHANFGLANGNMTSANFLRITAAADPRILQLALRFSW